MPLKATYAKLDEIPEALRSLYAEKDGKYVLDIEAAEVETLAAGRIAGLKKNAETLLAEKRAAADELAKFKAAGLTADDIAKLKEEREKAEQQKALDEGRYNDLLRQQTDKQAQELARRDERERFLTGQLEAKYLEADAIAAISAAQGVPEILLPHVRARLKMVEEGDGEAKRFVVRVVDDKGNPRLKDSVGNFMSVLELVEEFKANATFGVAFKATNAGGSGGGVHTAGGGGAKTVRAGDTEAIAAHLEAIAKGEITVVE
jgi:hypothetical protein